MIVFHQVHKHFDAPNPTPILDGINLTIKPGAIFAILGESGAGKSTLLRMINALETPTLGEVQVDGKKLNQLTPAEVRILRQSIGMIFQQFHLVSVLTVRENIELPIKILGEALSPYQGMIDELLEATELSAHAHKYPYQLSGGQQQRVAIARSLVRRPKILLCDEATSALDPETSLAILQLLKKLHDEYHLTIVLVSHDLSVVKSVCTDVALLEKGRIIETSPALEFFLKPQTPTSVQWIDTHEGIGIPSHLPVSETPTDTILLRLAYTDEAADAPVITRLVKAFPIEISILRGNIETIAGRTVGLLLVTLTGDPDAKIQALGKLRACGVQVKELGYVA